MCAEARPHRPRRSACPPKCSERPCLPALQCLEHVFLSHCTPGTATHSDLSCYCTSVTYLFPNPTRAWKPDMVNIQSNVSPRHENASQPPLQLFLPPHSSNFLLLSDPQSAADFLPRESFLCGLPPSSLHRKSPQGSRQCVAPSREAWSLPESAEGHPCAPKGRGLLKGVEWGSYLSMDAPKKATVAFLS